MRQKIFRYIFDNQVLVAILIVVTGWLIFEIRDVLVVLFISYILMAAISPYVDFLNKHHVPKPIAIFIPYLLTIVLVLLAVVALLPFFVGQIELLLTRFPHYITQAANLLNIKLNQPGLGSFTTAEIGSLGTGVFSITSKFFGSIFSAISIFVISFYLIVYKKQAIDSFIRLFPKKEQGKVVVTLREIEDKLGSWLRGQVILSLFIGVFVWLILTALGIEVALPLALIAGLLEIVPTIGPTAAAIPAVIVALTISLPMALIVGLAYVLVQFLEGHILVPRIMSRAVGLNPIVVIVGIIIGGKLLGISGALLAIPFVSLLTVVYKGLE